MRGKRLNYTERVIGVVRPVNKIKRHEETAPLKLGGKRNKKNNKQVRASYDRKRYLKAKIDKDIAEGAKILREQDQQIANREEIKTLAGSAPTITEMRAAVNGLFKSEDLNPIKELISLVKKTGKGALSSREKASVLKTLAEYQAPKPKSVDIQADINANVSVAMIDFSKTGVENMKRTEAATDEDYEEFEKDTN